MLFCLKCKKPLPEGALFCPYCGKKQTKEPRKALKRANGLGSVYKLQGRRRKPWAVAKSGTFIGCYATKTEALEVLEKLSGVNISEHYNMTFSQVFEKWKAEHYREIGTSGAEAYDNSFRIAASLHDKKFRSLRTSDFQAIIDENSKRSKSTLSKYKQLFTQMSSWAMREELISTNFARFVKLPDEGEKKEKEIFSAEDIKKLEQDGSDAARIILMLIYTGMRIGELFSLPLKDYHKTYVVGGEKTKAGRNRVIPIMTPGMPHFEHFAQIADGDLLLSGYTGQRDPRNFRNRDYYKTLERLEISRKTPHSTRHTFASIAMKAGVKTEYLQKVLGHASYQTTADTYIHSNVEELVAAIQSIDVTNRLLTDEDIKEKGKS